MTLEEEYFLTGETVKNEIIELHQFFEDYFQGKIPNNSIEVVEQALSQQFTIITPNGSIAKREKIIQLIRSGYNSTKTRKIWVEGIKTRIVDNVIIAQYIELQDIDDVKTKRVSTAVFRFSAQGKNYCKWESVHETWCQ